MSTQGTGQSIVSKVPSLEENSAERRRQLNILAQRRYRKRKQARFKELEQRAETLGNETSSLTSSTVIPLRRPDHAVTTSLQALESDIPEFTYEISPGGDGDDNDGEVAVGGRDSNATFRMTGFDFDPSFDPGFMGGQQDTRARQITDPTPTFLTQSSLGSLNDNIPASTIMTPLSNSTGNGAKSQWTSVPMPTSTSMALSMSSRHDFDDYAISVPGLSVLRAHYQLFKHMYGADYQINMFDPFTISPFCFKSPDSNNMMMTTDQNLPAHYRPTPLQKAIEHHPIIDCLPWVSFRDRFLYVMSLPREMRPKIAQNDMPAVILELMFAVKDAGGGLRVWASNPFIPENWEIGQTFYRKFWWAIDGDIVRHSNLIRARRGESALRFDILDTL